MKEKPVFIHDCNNCIFLGNTYLSQSENNMGDMYYCPRLDGYGSIVIRHGNDGSDYYSSRLNVSIISSFECDSNITDSYKMAIKNGIELKVITKENILDAIYNIFNVDKRLRN